MPQNYALFGTLVKNLLKIVVKTSETGTLVKNLLETHAIRETHATIATLETHATWIATQSVTQVV